jgi:hypothetical protein
MFIHKRYSVHDCDTYKLAVATFIAAAILLLLLVELFFSVVVIIMKKLDAPSSLIRPERGGYVLLRFNIRRLIC